MITVGTVMADMNMNTVVIRGHVIPGHVITIIPAKNRLAESVGLECCSGSGCIR